MKGEKGQALPLAMLALTIGALIIVPFLGHVGTSLIGSRTYGSSIAVKDSCDAGVEHAIWSLTRGTLAAQLANPGDNTTYQLGEALNGMTTTVTVTTNSIGAGAAGTISNAVLSTLQFDTSNGWEPAIIQISSTVYAIAYRGVSNDGYLKTVSIAADGTISPSVISTLEFDTSDCYTPDIIHISGNVYAIAYRGSSNRGYLKTVTIATNGTISPTVISSLTFDSSAGYEPNIIAISGNVYAIAYRGASTHGTLKTVTIATNGTISATIISTLTFDTNTGYEPNIIHISGNVYAIAYRGASTHGTLKTVTIATNGTISATIISTLIFDSSAGYEPVITQVASTIFAIAYRGASNRGNLKTVSIAANGTIGGSTISTLVFDSSAGYTPDIVAVSSTVFAIVYSNGSTRGYLKTVSIAADGTINQTVVDTLNFETSACYEPAMVYVSNNIYAIAYRGPSTHGFIITVGISAGQTASVYKIVSTAGGMTINALVSANSTAASITSWQVQ